MKTRIRNWIQTEIKDYKVLMRNIPAIVVTAFVMSVILMNLLANKEIYTGVPWIALDCGLLISWLSFLSMDIITKRFGARASIKISIFATCLNLVVCGVLYLASSVPGNWGEFYATESEYVNEVLNNTIGGTWYVLLGSSVAFLVSAVFNSLINAGIGKMMKTDGFCAYAARSWISTIAAQFIDNMIFALMVSHVFFGWTLIQCVTCSLTGCVMELIFQAIFSPFGFRVTQQWESEKVGQDYLDYANGGK